MGSLLPVTKNLPDKKLRQKYSQTLQNTLHYLSLLFETTRHFPSTETVERLRRGVVVTEQ